MNVNATFAINQVDFAFSWSSLPLAINSWQLLHEDSDGHTRRTADPIRPFVYCGFLTCVGLLGAAAMLS